jgi:hypothetical protein
MIDALSFPSDAPKPAVPPFVIKRLELTTEDCELGERYRADACPINRAAERAFGVPCRTMRTNITVGDTSHLARLPDVARQFMYEFDVGRSPAPISFDVVDPWAGAAPTPCADEPLPEQVGPAY